MGAIASQITSLTIVYSTVYSGAGQRKHQSSASLAFVRGIHRGPVNSPHKWPVTRKMFPFDDVIIWANDDHVHQGLHSDVGKPIPHFLYRVIKPNNWIKIHHCNCIHIWLTMNFEINAPSIWTIPCLLSVVLYTLLLKWRESSWGTASMIGKREDTPLHWIHTITGRHDTSYL